MRAGKLRHRIQIEAPVTSQDAESGEPITSWQLVAEVWGSVEPLSAREFVQSQATQAEIVARITLRRHDALVPTMRLIHRGLIYNPEGFLPDMASGREYLTIPCSTGLNDGQ